MKHWQATSSPPLYLNCGAPRVRPEAKEFASHSVRGTVGMLLQVEGHNPFSAGRKPKPEPRDHVRENVRRMRQIQRASKKRDEEKQTPVKAMWKSSKYEGVPSRVRAELEKDPDAPRPHSTNFLRAHSRTGVLPPHRPYSAEPSEEQLTVPSAQSARDVKLKRNDVNFIKVNGSSVKHVGMRRSPSLTALDELKKKKDEEMASYQPGEVPKYLQHRKKQWEEEEHERRASVPDPDLPEGHKLMPTRERLETLDKLRATERELLAQLNSMPIRTDTPRVRACKDQIDRKLMEIDEAIKIFSRNKVFVKMDA